MGAKILDPDFNELADIQEQSATKETDTNMVSTRMEQTSAFLVTPVKSNFNVNEVIPEEHPRIFFCIKIIRKSR